MKSKLFGRIGTIVLAVTMMLGTSIPVCAAEKTDANQVAEYRIEVNEKEGVTPMAIGKPASGTVAAKGEITLYPELYSYVGIQRSFSLSTSSMKTQKPSGTVFVYVYKPNGELFDAWKMGANDYYFKTYNLPSSGTYTVEINTGVNEPVFVSCTWTTPAANQ